MKFGIIAPPPTVTTVLYSSECMSGASISIESWIAPWTPDWFMPIIDGQKSTWGLPEVRSV